MGTRTRWGEKRRKLNPVIRIHGDSEAGADQERKKSRETVRRVRQRDSLARRGARAEVKRRDV